MPYHSYKKQPVEKNVKSKGGRLGEITMNGGMSTETIDGGLLGSSEMSTETHGSVENDEDQVHQKRSPRKWLQTRRRFVRLDEGT